jgi:hypothetical protein
VHPVHSLRLYHWVPLGFDQVYVVGHGEINSNTITLCELWQDTVITQAVNSPFPSAANTGKHDRIGWIVVELMKGLAPVFKACLAVNPLEAKAVFLECLLD